MNKKIFENKEYVIYSYGDVRRHKGCRTYRVHFFSDEKTTNGDEEKKLHHKGLSDS